MHCVNCIHNDSSNGCTNLSLPKSFFGFGPRVCVEFVTGGRKTCPAKEPHHRPPPPSTPVPVCGEPRAIDLPTATQRINDILRDLEISTGSVVESIELNDIDVTTVNDRGQQLVRSVQIEMKRLPGTKWC